MGLAGLSVDTESAERSVESTQMSEDNQSVRIKQYGNKSGTVFGVYGQQPGSIPGQGDTSTNSSGISSPGSSQHGSPARVGSNPARGRRRRARSEPRRPRRGENEKESSPGSDYGSLLSDVETGDSLVLKPGDSLELKPGDSLVLNPGESSSPLITGDSSLHLTCESSMESQRFIAKDCKGVQKGESPDEQTPRQQRRQRQRSASESISDRLSDAQAQRDKDLEDLWPESNSLDRNTSQYGNNVVAVRGAKLQQSDVFQRGCQVHATVAVIGNDEFRLTEKNAVAKTGARLIDSNGITDRTAVGPTGGRVQISGGNRTNCCGSCERERRASPPRVPTQPRVPVPSHSQHPPQNTTSPAPAAQCKPKQPDPATSATPLHLLPKSRSFILPRSQRPSLTAALSSCSRLQPCRVSCRTDRRVLQQGWDGAGIPPDDYHQRTKSQQQQHTDPRDTQTSSHESLLLTGLTKSHNKCNNYSKSEDYNYSSRCHGDGLGTGSVAGLWWTSGGRAAGCHGSSCCLNVVQDVLSRIPVVAPPTRLSSVLDLRTCNTPPAAALLPAEYPLCNARYVSTSTPPIAPHYVTMRIKRSATSSLMGNLPCWKQRHNHDDNVVKTKHVSYVQYFRRYVQYFRRYVYLLFG